MTIEPSAAIPLDDRGLLLGDGLFETLCATQGQLEAFDAHYERLLEGCEAIGLPLMARDDMRQICEQAIDMAGLKDKAAVVRFTLTAGGGGRGLVRPSPLHLRAFARAVERLAAPASVSLGLATIRRNEHSPLSRHKTLNYLDNILARQAAMERGFDDALMLNTKGEIACVTAGNIFWFEDEILITPTIDCGILAGITRAKVMEAARKLKLEVRETFQTLKASELEASRSGSDVFAPYDLSQRSDTPKGPFAGAFVCNSVIGLVPVSKMGSLNIAPHPILTHLRKQIRT